jgi:hypothetical protein
MSKLNKAQMHQRPTYGTLVKDIILEPKAKIALPDRQATILGKTQQLSRYDDAEFLDIETDNEKQRKNKHNKQPSTPQRKTITAEALGKHERTSPVLIKDTILRNLHQHNPIKWTITVRHTRRPRTATARTTTDLFKYERPPRPTKKQT